MTKRKIALLLFNYFPYGGLQKDFYFIAKELKRRGFELQVFTGIWNGSNPEKFLIKELGIKGFSNHRRNINFYKKVKKAMESFSPDLVFGFNKIPELDFYFASDTCFKYKVRISRSELYRFSTRYRKSLEYEKAVFGADSKTKILLLNKKQKSEFISEYQTNLDRMDIVPPGIPLDWASNKPSGIREDLGLDEKAELLLFVGSDFKRKGLDRAIEVLDYLNKKKNIYLLIAGQDEGRPYKELLKLRNLSSKVFFLGPVEDINGLMLESDLLIHPAREEAAGNVIIEAMVSSLPILTCSSVGFSSLVEDNKAGLVLKGNFDQASFNLLAKELTTRNINLELKKNMSHLKNKDYFYSRFSYVADSIESYLDEK